MIKRNCFFYCFLLFFHCFLLFSAVFPLFFLLFSTVFYCNPCIKHLNRRQSMDLPMKFHIKSIIRSHYLSIRERNHKKIHFSMSLNKLIVQLAILACTSGGSAADRKLLILLNVVNREESKSETFLYLYSKLLCITIYYHYHATAIELEEQLRMNQYRDVSIVRETLPVPCDANNEIV